MMYFTHVADLCTALFVIVMCAGVLCRCTRTSDAATTTRLAFAAQPFAQVHTLLSFAQKPASRLYLNGKNSNDYKYSETSLKRPPKGPGNSGRYREVVRIGSATLTCAKNRSMLSLIYCSFNFVI